MSELKRSIPAAVQRQLRQEAGFGCASCGCPILDYHHIIEWNEHKHHDPQHMVALCPSCHRQFGKLSKTRAYKLKQDPINIRNKRINGYLGGNGEQKSLKCGSFTFDHCDHILEMAGNSILSYKLEDFEFKVSAFIPDANFFPDIEIRDNNFSANTTNFWDIEFKQNWIKFRKGPGDVFFTLDFRGDYVQILADLDLMGEKVSFTEKGYRDGRGNTINAAHISNCKTAFVIGSNFKKIHRPNFAQLRPQPIADI